MKAIRIHKTGGREVLQFEDLENPVCQADQVIVNIKSASVNYSDVLIRKGDYPYMPEFPAILGNEASGVITQVGSDVTHLKVGQRVIVFGGPAYATEVAAKAKSIIPIPDAVDFDEAAALPIIYLTAYHMLHTVRRVKAGETVLVHAAAGGVGTALVQLAKIANITLIGLTSKDDKATVIKEMGYQHVINYKTEDVVARVNEITNDRGVDLIIDCIGGPRFDDNFKMLATLGHIIWYGIVAGPPTTDFKVALGSRPHKCHSVSMFHLYGILNNPALMMSSFKTLIGYLLSGQIKPVIHTRIPLADAGKAHAILENHENIGKVILKP
jgi:NADPH:quinone reductase